MPFPEATSMILRFRDLVTAPGQTIEMHHAISAKEGYVWWGWWSKFGETIPDEAMRHLKLLATSGGLDVFLLDSGRDQVFRTKCLDIEWKADHQRQRSPDPNNTPEYYRDRDYLMWFRLTNIETTLADPAILKLLTYTRVDGFFQQPPSRFSEFYGKQVSSTEELRQQDRTIWFVRPFRSGDPTHHVKLLDPRKLSPSHFPKEFIEKTSIAFFGYPTRIFPLTRITLSL